MVSYYLSVKLPLMGEIHVFTLRASFFKILSILADTVVKNPCERSPYLNSSSFRTTFYHFTDSIPICTHRQRRISDGAKICFGY